MPVALAAATVSKRSVIRGVELLKYKESDRVATVLDVLYRLGVDAKYQDGVLYIKGPPVLGAWFFKATATIELP